MSVDRVFRDLGLVVLERGWLSSNNVLFSPQGGAPATLVDTSYAAHAEQTLSLVKGRLGPVPLARVVNTHLHSDHCGGNSLLQRHYDCETWVPESLVAPVTAWDAARLTFEMTDQRCERFRVSHGLAPGEDLRLGEHRWLTIAVDGHDPDSVVFFQPESRVLISADALWEDRLAIIFPEIEAQPGFAAARRSLEVIEALEPAIVIPGHGRPFTGVREALSRSRSRLDRYEADPATHLRHAARALAMFHLLEQRRRELAELVTWLSSTPIFVRIAAGLGARGASLREFAEDLVRGLMNDAILRIDSDGHIVVIDR